MGRLVKGAGRVIPAAVLSAKEEAARISGDARAAADGLRRDAETRGFQEGLAAGREAGLAQVTEILVAARADAEEARAQATEGAVVLARRMAEKIVGRAIELAPEVMGDIVSQALAASRARKGAAVVRVHPDDLALVEASRPSWLARAEAQVSVRVVADASVGRHGCVVDTPVGRLDARLDTQLAALARALARPDAPAR